MTAAYPPGDPRAVLAGQAPQATAPRPAEVFELSAEEPDRVLRNGTRSWLVRAQNFCLEVTALVTGDELAEASLPEEHIVLVQSGAVRVSHEDDGPVEVADPSVVIVPPGSSRLQAGTDALIVRLFSAHMDQVVARARNAGSYRTADPTVRRLPAPEMTNRPGLRVHRLADVPVSPGRLGRIFRSSTLMVNWFADEHQPRDPARLSPHSHDDFEQGSITLAGDFVHHLRTPWTPRLADWREDEHHLVTSPSVTIIPPPVVHTTQGVGEGLHQLVDVFAPPRADFLAQGWVLNAADYPEPGDPS
ncbi:hypothetical protein ACFVWG_06305 [Kribbella sp. NPDC058245]|uniref:hypothetical protein n=1 Tax=Kribbella sp. NPDC058245 TaxID=3346399 RepID=UPI0036E323F6